MSRRCTRIVFRFQTRLMFFVVSFHSPDEIGHDYLLLNPCLLTIHDYFPVSFGAVGYTVCRYNGIFGSPKNLSILIAYANLLPQN
jgi:hypothetical protein